MSAAATTVDEYLAGLPEADRAALEQLRQAIHSAAPGAVESISYAMPTFKYRGKRLIYFAAAKNHCAIYGTSAGTLRFTPAEPPSPGLITSLVRERVESIESAEAAPAKKRKRVEARA